MILHTTNRIAAAATAAWLVLILAITLSPHGDATARAVAAQTGFFCFPCGPRGLLEFGWNVVLFVPLGVGLSLAGMPPRWAILFPAILSAGIEVSQLGIVGRDTTFADLAANTLGAAVGALLVLHWHRLWQGIRDLNPTLRAFASIAIPLAAALAFATLARFESLGGVQLAAQPPECGPVRTRSAPDGTWEAEVRLKTIDNIVGDNCRTVNLLAGAKSMVAVSQDAKGVTVRVRARGREFGLRSPSVRVAYRRLSALEEARVTVRVAPGEFRVAVNAGSITAGGSVAAAPSSGWMLILPVPFAGTPIQAVVLGSVLLAILALVSGMAAGMASRRGMQILVAEFGAVGLLAIQISTSPVNTATLVPCFGILLGQALGYTLARAGRPSGVHAPVR